MPNTMHEKPREKHNNLSSSLYTREFVKQNYKRNKFELNSF